MIENILSFLIAIAVLETLSTIFSINENIDKNNLDCFDSYEKSKPPQLKTLSFYESNEYKYISGEQIINIPSSYNIEEINNCYLLLNEFSINCLNNKIEYNYDNYDCIKLLEEKLYEFKKCDLIYSTISPFYSEEDKTYDIKYNVDDIFLNIEYEYDEKYLNSYNNNEEEIEFEEKNNKKEEIFKEIIKESFIMKNEKDCVEYELSEEDENLIKCSKYE